MDIVASSPRWEQSSSHAASRIDECHLHFASRPLDTWNRIVSIFAEGAVLVYLDSINDKPRRVCVEYPNIELDIE